MIHLSLIFIAEYQADALFFGFRSKLSAIQPIAFLFNKLVTSEVIRRSEGAFTRKGSQ